jgi:ring-1,2-phenylacetyl-CoA epoxidase subunit PaaD
MPAPADQDILAVLEQVPDPEIPVVSVVDLGIVQGIERSLVEVTVVITPTYTGCPATAVIQQSIRVALDEAGLQIVAIESRLSPAWTTDNISDAGREKLRAYGIAPPPRGSAASTLGAPAQCPRCGSSNTREISRFGSTPCKALWQCHACQEPFDRFKCH